MSRKKRGQQNSNQERGGAAPEAPQREPARTQTEAERILSKVKRSHALLEEALSRAVQCEVPNRTVVTVREAAIMLAAVRLSVEELVAGGWVPAKKVPLKDLQEGDAITIAPKHRAAYPFIPGLEDNTAGLVASTIVRSKNGRVLRVLVRRPAKGDPMALDGLGQRAYEPEQHYGYAPLAHLERATKPETSLGVDVDSE